jgi:hypothetical protein
VSHYSSMRLLPSRRNSPGNSRMSLSPRVISPGFLTTSDTCVISCTIWVALMCTFIVCAATGAHASMWTLAFDGQCIVS